MHKIFENHKTWLAVAFTGGVLLTLGFKDFYPDLERRFRRRRLENDKLNLRPSHPVSLVENESRARPEHEIPEGIEGTIGNTPLFKIKSLSEATGCEILAKAEVDVWRLAGCLVFSV